MKQHHYYVYSVTNASNNVLYTGVTNDIENRILQHREKINQGFTAKYQCSKLVYYEEFQWVQDAIARENRSKRVRGKRRSI